MKVQELKEIVDKTYMICFKFRFRMTKDVFNSHIFCSLKGVSSDNQNKFILEKINEHFKNKPEIMLIDGDTPYEIKELSCEQKEKMFNHYANLIKKGRKVLYNY